jgi:hypothetical protein
LPGVAAYRGARLARREALTAPSVLPVLFFREAETAVQTCCVYRDQNLPMFSSEHPATLSTHDKYA